MDETIHRTEQMGEWSGQFGKAYTDRNALTLEGMENLYRESYGTTRTELNTRFVGDMDHSTRILEVGSNVGNQLACLQQMGFTQLYGIELQSYAVALSKSRTTGINIIQGSAFDIPYKDAYFDLVFTSGVLIHISPDDLGRAMDEIHRCCKDYIWGFEYYADSPTAVKYRGNDNLLWKADFAKMYLDRFPELKLAKEDRLKYLESDNVDCMFLITKAR